MKLELFGDILKSILPFLKARTVFYFSLIIMLAFWAAFLFPTILDFFKLSVWQVNNAALISWGTIATTLFFIIIVLVNLDNKVSRKLDKRHQKKGEQKKFQDLSTAELIYLYQFIYHNTTLVEFDETDPVVGQLSNKRLIFPSISNGFRRMSNPRFRSSYEYGCNYEISPEDFQYFSEHLELFQSIINNQEGSKSRMKPAG